METNFFHKLTKLDFYIKRVGFTIESCWCFSFFLQKFIHCIVYFCFLLWLFLFKRKEKSSHKTDTLHTVVNSRILIAVHFQNTMILLSEYLEILLVERTEQKKAYRMHNQEYVIRNGHLQLIRAAHITGKMCAHEVFGDLLVGYNRADLA